MNGFILLIERHVRHRRSLALDYLGTRDVYS